MLTQHDGVTGRTRAKAREREKSMPFHSRSGASVTHAARAAALLLPLLSGLGVANAAIVTNSYTVTNFSAGSSNPDGAFYPSGTAAVVSIKLDDALTYIGGPDVTLSTTVSIPSGLKVAIGADVFTADTYYIDFYNAGPGRGSADITFHTGFFPFSLLPTLHNGLPITSGAFPVQMQFTFFGVSDFTPKPIAPGLSFPIPPYVGEGFVRDYNNTGEYFFPQGSWAAVPTPGAAALLSLAALTTTRRRRR